MFRPIQHRLLLSYTDILIFTLSTFALAVRLVFTQNLQHVDSDTHQLLGYVRVSESLQEFDQTLRQRRRGAEISRRNPNARCRKIEAIASATRQMTHLTEDLLFLARHDQMPQRNWKPVNLALLLSDLIQQQQPQAMAKLLYLKAAVNQPASVMGDAAQLTRLFTNLIDNALHYTLTGSIELRLSRILHPLK